MKDQPASDSDRTRTASRRLRMGLTGRVQGVGFRPRVWNLARELGLSGWVNNTSAGVTIEIEGATVAVDAFAEKLRRSLPPNASIDSFEVTEQSLTNESGFRIIASDEGETESTPIPPDRSVCEACLTELRDPEDRRFEYPFINCTHCGPRFTIIESLPYDRKVTTMKSFQMCPACQQEYEDPSDRRFHAQPNACPQCGPCIWMVEASDGSPAITAPPSTQNSQSQTLDQFASAIRSGKTIAVKGVGGFHLACDASNPRAIALLRQRKKRIGKPLAIMISDAGGAERFAVIGDEQRRVLESAERPIVLLEKRDAFASSDGMESGSAGSVALDEISPGNRSIGVMLPYSPLHVLLCDRCGPLVMTSGNLSEEPIAISNQEAFEQLGDLADTFLFHDRQIHVACDDSVVASIGDHSLPIRRSRGFAPDPIVLREPGPTVLAVGAELKSTFCVMKDRYAYLSQHIGDLEQWKTLQAFRESISHLLDLFRAKPDIIAADLHPDYHSTRFAMELAQSLGVPLIRVQHHLAHAASLRCEHHLASNEPILACCFDGTGLGDDQSIWGGEFLLCDDVSYRRLSHLRYFSLPGGDQSIRKPYRSAIGLLHQCESLAHDSTAPFQHCSDAERAILRTQLDRKLNTVPTSSMGRLFDAVASLIGIRHEVSYEAQAAIELECLASCAIDCVTGDPYRFEMGGAAGSEILWSTLVRDVLDDVARRTPSELIAARFHHAVSEMVATVCAKHRQQLGFKFVGLTGGVFQNNLLSSLTRERLEKRGFAVLTHQVVPPNDAGISIGQASIARARYGSSNG